MDAKNENEIVSKEAQEYWKNVDFYVGGSEHAVGHLLYSRFWHKFLKDIGKVSTEEPFQKMVNQGMIGGRSLLTKIGQIKNVEIQLHIPVLLAENDKLYKENFEQLKAEDNRFENISSTDVQWENDKEGRTYISLEVQLEKMSKRYLNVVNPDDMVTQYGADTFRMYEMFLGPIDTAKPWDTNGISGVSNFLRKFWRLYFEDNGTKKSVAQEATTEELKILHKTIKKINDDIERLAFNTCVSTFMIGVNELSKLKSVSATTQQTLVRLIAPFAPHTAEILWTILGHTTCVVSEEFPVHDEQYLLESNFNYPIQINGKHRANIEIALDMPQDKIQQIVMADERVLKFTEGKTPKKFIVVPGRIINVVV